MTEIFSISDEIKREREFYRARGLPCPKDVLPNAGEVEEEKANADAHAESDYHRTDEQVIAGSIVKDTDSRDCSNGIEINVSNWQVNVCLECTNSSLKTLKRRFIRCSAQATITHMKKFIAKKALNGMEKYRDVSILGDCERACHLHLLIHLYFSTD